MKNILALTGIESTAITASEDAQKLRDTLLFLAKGITTVGTTEEAEAAGRALTSIKTFTRSIEDARSVVKAPVLDLGKRIDTLAKELTLEADQEAGRISRLVGAYNADQARLAERKRQEAYAEEQRIIEETRKKLADAEAAGASDKKLDKIEDKAVEKLLVAKAATAAVITPRLAGVSTRSEICFEVTDLTVLYKAFPMLVTLTPNNQAIKACLKSSPGGLPGVRHWTEDRAIVR